MTTWKPHYAEPRIVGAASVQIDVGPRSYGLPEASRVASSNEGAGSISIALLPDAKLLLLTSRGAVTNLTERAASAR